MLKVPAIRPAPEVGRATTAEEEATRPPALTALVSDREVEGAGKVESRLRGVEDGGSDDPTAEDERREAEGAELGSTMPLLGRPVIAVGAGSFPG